MPLDTSNPGSASTDPETAPASDDQRAHERGHHRHPEQTGAAIWSLDPTLSRGGGVTLRRIVGLGDEGERFRLAPTNIGASSPQIGPRRAAVTGRTDSPLVGRTQVAQKVPAFADIHRRFGARQLSRSRRRPPVRSARREP